MGSLKSTFLSCLALSAVIYLVGCTAADNQNNATATTNVPAPTASPSPQNLVVVDRPQAIKDMMAARGEQDMASPTLKIVEPREGATINGSTVNVKLDLSGDLKGYKPMKDPNTGMGNHIHVILDNQPYEAYYDISQPFELRNVTEGKHTLRVFPSRPWHESYKNPGAFQMVSFNVKGGGDASKPTTTNTGQVMSNNNAAKPANSNAAAPQAAQEGKDMLRSEGGNVDITKPLLTYSRPKGDYKGADANAIMIDFWLSGGKLQGDGGDYRVKYSVDGTPAQYIDKWSPIWLSGWNPGSHTVQLELVDRNGNVVDNGGYNLTNRTITVAK
jgi:hypothetical protein